MAKEIKITPAAATKKKIEDSTVEFAFGRENYMLVFVGLALVVLGFILMLGGGSDDPKVFNEAVYNFQRLTLAPILILAGFVVEIFAIMKKPKD
jgi:hypothetical protein